MHVKNAKWYSTIKKGWKFPSSPCSNDNVYSFFVLKPDVFRNHKNAEFSSNRSKTACTTRTRRLAAAHPTTTCLWSGRSGTGPRPWPGRLRSRDRTEIWVSRRRPTSRRRRPRSAASPAPDWAPRRSFRICFSTRFACAKKKKKADDFSKILVYRYVPPDDGDRSKKSRRRARKRAGTIKDRPHNAGRDLISTAKRTLTSLFKTIKNNACFSF